MESARRSNDMKGLNPWWILVFTAPVPMLLFGFFFVKWYNQKSECAKTTHQFLQRQNTVLGYNAIEVSTNLSDFLEKAARDVQTLALIPPTVDNYRRFHASDGRLHPLRY